MSNPSEFQVGDIVRIRQTINLVPLDARAPSEIPAGIYGEIIYISTNTLDEPAYIVEFHEPYELFNDLPLMGAHLELMFRHSMN